MSAHNRKSAQRTLGKQIRTAPHILTKESDERV